MKGVCEITATHFKNKFANKRYVLKIVLKNDILLMS